MRIPAILLFGPIACCLAQTSSTVSLSNGVQLRIASTPTALKEELAPASGNSFYRIFRDENNLAVFAYEVQVVRTPDGDQFRITALPAGAEFAGRFPNADGGKPTPTLPAPMESPLLASGGDFTVNIPTDPGLKENLTDTIQIQLKERGAPPSEADLDAAQLRFAALRVYIGGRLVSPTGAGAILAGRFVMFYVPGHGAYFFSAGPVQDRHPFAQVGMVDRGNLEFTLDNEEYRCRSNAPILVHSDRGQIWVYHDPNYRPAGNWTKNDPADVSREEFFAAASDSLNWWLP